MTKKEHLIIIIAFCQKDNGAQRLMAKLFASSLMRSQFQGDICVIHNSERPLYGVKRANCTEFRIATPELAKMSGPMWSQMWKPNIRKIINANDYNRVMVVDSDCLAFDDLSQYFNLCGKDKIMSMKATDRGRLNCDYTVMTVRPESDWEAAVNPWCIILPGSKLHDTFEEWQRLMVVAKHSGTVRPDIAAWNFLRESAEDEHALLSADGIEECILAKPYFEWRNAKFVHFGGMMCNLWGKDCDQKGPHDEQKWAIMYGVWMQHFMCNSLGGLIDILEV